jgi:hypothetical protein
VNRNFSGSRAPVEQMTSVIWTTPMGLPIVQPYRRIKRKQLITPVQSVYIGDPNLQTQVNPNKQSSAFPPNFIHSLDATHMMLTALECRVSVLDASIRVVTSLTISCTAGGADIRIGARLILDSCLHSRQDVRNYSRYFRISAFLRHHGQTSQRGACRPPNAFNLLTSCLFYPSSESVMMVTRSQCSRSTSVK